MFSFFVNFSPLLLPFWAGRDIFLQGGLVYANRMFTRHPYPLCRYCAGVRLRIFHEKNAARRCAARFNRLCRRGHGSGVDLLIPAMEQSEGLGRLAFIPAAVGFWLGIGFLLLLDMAVPHLHQGADTPEGPHSGFSRTTMLVLAVTLHNIPEGMAVGVVYAGYLTGSASITAMGALALSLGIAIQNFPEGAIISMPLKAEGMSRGRAFWAGTLSGAVEPVGALFTIWAAGLVVPALPYLLSFAAGAMIYVVVEELIPEMSQGEHSNVGTICFALGFSVMMVLDVALG